MVFIQAQDATGMWRTFQVTLNNPQLILSAMQSLKNRLPSFRVRAIDADGRVVDIYG